MKKLLRLAAACVTVGLLVSSGAFAQEVTITPVASPSTSITVQPAGQPGFLVCYRPAPRHVEASRIVQRCGYNGCQNFRVTREFEVTAYTDCHLESVSCPRGYKKFGWYPSKMDAKSAMRRCSNTIMGDVPSGAEWRVNY